MDNLHTYRVLTPAEITALESRGCSAESWEDVWVGEDFSVEQLWRVRLEGRIYIAQGATIVDSALRNYHIGQNAKVESVTRLECRTTSRFGNGVKCAVVNECAGRAIKLYDDLRAQLAYVWAMFRHRPDFCHRIDAMVERYAQTKESQIGHIGEGSTIIGAKFIREVNIGKNVTIDGASLLSNGTVCDGAYIGIDVKARNFIAAQGATIDTGATIDRCMVGESSIVANGFTAVDSVFFGNSHLENGEAASVFGGPYTVSHHKSSLLIAGLFSFFNAGSGSNQSNHLFKTGAVHQSIHPRGCKFASGAYIMAPAVEGAFTMVKGYHAKHHDTLAFPFSYLINDGDASTLMPGANLVSYGTRRDIDKWGARDKRTIKREPINFEEHNPYITSMMVNAVNTIHALRDEQPDSEQYMWNRVTIKPAHLRRGEGLYNKAIVSSLGAMLSVGEKGDGEGKGAWIDAAGQYITTRAVEEMINYVESEAITSLSQIDSLFEAFYSNYTSHAYDYAYWLLGELLGHTPSEEEVNSAIASAQSSREALDKMIHSDMGKDCNMSMAVGYGLHGDKEEDYREVRGLKT